MAPRSWLALAAPLLLLAAHGAHGSRLLSGPSNLVSDGVIQMWSQGHEVCEETYGFLPCTTSALGNLFLLLVYGSLMFLAATYMSNGSEMLLQILGPGIIGGLFLPALGALPDAILILGKWNFSSLKVFSLRLPPGVRVNFLADFFFVR